MNVLLTGGTGYIGSHTAVALAGAGHRVVLYDNFLNSRPDVLHRLEQITNTSIGLVEGDVRDTSLLRNTLEKYDIDAVYHFAGLKAVGESIVAPLRYYANNVQGAISLLEAMTCVYGPQGLKTLVFSSSAAVYGDPNYLPIDEEHPLCALNPYGRTKAHIEDMLRDVALSDTSWRIVCLRYFNPVGAHTSGLIGDAPNSIPSNLLPYILQVATGKQPVLQVFGDDYPTPDGTGIRDYIHVMDLAEGHLAALDYLCTQNSGVSCFNLGTGHGHSVFEIMSAFETYTGQSVPYQIQARRIGDAAACYAKVDKSAALLSWRASRTMKDIIEHSWGWESQQIVHE